MTSEWKGGGGGQLEARMKTRCLVKGNEKSFILLLSQTAANDSFM